MDALPRQNRSRFRESAILLAILLLAFALRLFALSRCRFVGSDGGVDGVEMVRLGRSLFSGEGFASRGRPELVHAPLFPVLTGLAWILTGDLELSGQAVSVIFGALTVLPVYFLAMSLFCPRVAFLSAFFVAVCPFGLYTATEVRLESLYAFLVAASALALYRFALSPRPLAAALAGAAIAFSYLARPEAVLFLPLAALLPLLAPGPPLRSRLPGLLRGWACFAAAFALLSAPYWIFLRVHSGHWTLSARTPFTFVPYFEENWEEANFRAYAYPDELRARWREEGGLITFLRAHAPRVAKSLGKNLLSLSRRAHSPRFEKFGIPPRLISLGLPLAAAAAVLFFATKAVRRRFRFRDAFLLLFFSPALAYVVFVSDAFFTLQELRYFYYYLPLGYILLASACSGWMNWFGAGAASPLRRALARAPAAVAALALLAASLGVAVRKIETVPYEYKLMGLWMRDHLPGISGRLVMSRKMGVPFYADAGHALIHPGGYGEILGYARETGADYLVVDDWSTPWARPALAFLLDDARPPPPELIRVQSLRYRGRRIVLYAFAPGAGEGPKP